MFGGALSLNAESAARKGAGGNKKKSSGGSQSTSSSTSSSSTTSSAAVDELSNGTDAPDGLNLLPDNALPLVYFEGPGGREMTREIIMQFFDKCTAMMLEEKNIAYIVKTSVHTNKALHLASMEFQRSVLRNNFQTDKDYGCKYMSMIPMHSPNDLELIEASKGFMFAATKSYLKAIHYRKKHILGEKLITSGKLSRNQIFEFFEACNVTMSQEETKSTLKELFAKTGTAPNLRIIEYQHEILELLGFDRHHAVSCLNSIQQDYAGDQEMILKMQQFATAASLACQEAMMTELERKAFYADIPSFMHHFPHIFVHKQQMERQRQMMMMAQQQQGGGGGGGGSAGGGVPSSMQQQQQQHMMLQSGIMQLMSTEEGQSKIKSLSTRITEGKARTEAQLATWGPEDKKAFFESLGDLPALKSIASVTASSSSSPSEKIESFLSLSDAELDSMLLIQGVLADDIRSGGTMTTALLHSKDEPGQGTNQKQIFQTLGVFKQMAGLANMATGVPPPNFAHMHAHGHAHGQAGHVHGPHCRHGLHGAAPVNDVASGKKEVMDR